MVLSSSMKIITCEINKTYFPEIKQFSVINIDCFNCIHILFQYKEEVDTLNEASRERPRGALIASIERESRLMRDVQRENGELRAALEDHRRALELIMSKYRQHTEKRIWESRIDFTNAINEKQQEVCRILPIYQHLFYRACCWIFNFWRRTGLRKSYSTPCVPLIFTVEWIKNLH